MDVTNVMNYDTFRTFSEFIYQWKITKMYNITAVVKLKSIKLKNMDL